MSESNFESFISKFSKKNLEIGKDVYGRLYFSVSFFGKLIFIWLDKPGANESYFKQISSSPENIGDLSYSTYSSLLCKTKLHISGNIAGKSIIANIRETVLTIRKSIYFLTLKEKK